MALPMITAAVTLFYVSAIPIHLALRLKLGQDGGFGFGVAVFEPRFALRHALQLQPPGEKPSSSRKKSGRFSRFRITLRAVRYTTRHIRIDRIDLDGTFGSGDAALTALICGSAQALGVTLRCITKRDVRLHLRPDFSGGSLRAELTGMISMRVGHIMLAALLGAYQYGSRRLKEWTSTPLRVS